VTVEASKNGKTRHVPLSDYALELLGQLPRIDGCPFVFVWPVCEVSTFLTLKMVGEA